MLDLDSTLKLRLFEHTHPRGRLRKAWLRQVDVAFLGMRQSQLATTGGNLVRPAAVELDRLFTEIRQKTAVLDLPAPPLLEKNL